MTTTDARLAAPPRRTGGPRPRQVALLERTGPVPLAMAAMLTVLTLPMFILAPQTIPAGLALLAASAVYLVGARQLHRRTPGAHTVIGGASLAGLGAIVFATVSCHGLAARVGDASDAALYCLAAFALPTVIFAAAASLAWSRTVRRYADQG